MYMYIYMEALSDILVHVLVYVRARLRHALATYKNEAWV